MHAPHGSLIVASAIPLAFVGLFVPQAVIDAIREFPIAVG